MAQQKLLQDLQAGRWRAAANRRKSAQALPFSRQPGKRGTVAKCNAARNRQQEITVELAALLGPDASRRLQSNPNQIYASGLTVDVHGNGDSVSIQLRYKSVKVAKAMLKAYVKAGGLTE